MDDSTLKRKYAERDDLLDLLNTVNLNIYVEVDDQHGRFKFSRDGRIVYTTSTMDEAQAFIAGLLLG